MYISIPMTDPYFLGEQSKQKGSHAPWLGAALQPAVVSKEAGSLTNLTALQEDSKRVQRCTKRWGRADEICQMARQSSRWLKKIMRSAGTSSKQKEDMDLQAGILESNTQNFGWASNNEAQLQIFKWRLSWPSIKQVLGDKNLLEHFKINVFAYWKILGHIEKNVRESDWRHTLEMKSESCVSSTVQRNGRQLRIGGPAPGDLGFQTPSGDWFNFSHE